MDMLTNENKDLTNDIVDHLNRLQADLLRLKIQNNRNFILSKTVDVLIDKINNITFLVTEEPRFDLMVVYRELVRNVRLDSRLTGAQINLDWFPEKEPNRVLIKGVISKQKLDSYGLH